MEINFRPTIKQDEVFDLVHDKETSEILFGGGVGSAKSYLLAAVVTLACLEHPGIRVGLARNELTTLKKTTVVTFLELFGDWGLEPNVHYKYNSVAGEISFNNKSKIIMQELRYLPSDPEYTRLGGLLLTFGVIDEAGECDIKGKEIYQTRLGRWLNTKYDLKPTLLMTCNPSRNFLYKDFYQASKDNQLPSHRKFVSATVYDNPYIPEAYIDNLKRTLTSTEIQRLLYGNWEYDGDPNNLLTYDHIAALYKEVPSEPPGTRYISADIAFTSDKCVILVWYGYTIVEIKVMEKDSNVEAAIQALAETHNVNINRICYDSDGVGKYLMQYLRNATPIVNNARPYKNENYKNLKHQLFFKMCGLMAEGKIKIADARHQKSIEEELSVIRHKPRDASDSKIETNSKADIKRLIGRSPDFADAIAYRMVFEYISPGAYNFM